MVNGDRDLLPVDAAVEVDPPAITVRHLVATDGTVRLPSVQAFQLRSMGLVDLHGNDVT